MKQEKLCSSVPCTTVAESSSAAASSLEALVPVAQETEVAAASGRAWARANTFPLAHSRITPSSDPVRVYLHAKR